VILRIPTSSASEMFDRARQGIGKMIEIIDLLRKLDAQPAPPGPKPAPRPAARPQLLVESHRATPFGNSSPRWSESMQVSLKKPITDFPEIFSPSTTKLRDRSRRAGDKVGSSLLSTGINKIKDLGEKTAANEVDFGFRSSARGSKAPASGVQRVSPHQNRNLRA
jgi:hypothetical protein